MMVVAMMVVVVMAVAAAAAFTAAGESGEPGQSREGEVRNSAAAATATPSATGREVGKLG